ncbi:MAG: hypothetical protein ABIR16_03190 [Dokdonella sp.]
MSAHLTQKTAPDWALDLALWPSIDLDVLEPIQRESAKRWILVLTEYVRGTSVKGTLDSLDLCRPHLLRLFNRCITIAPDGQLYGWRGILKGATRKPYQRQAVVTASLGSAGALHKVFSDVTGLEQRLTDLVLKRGHRGEIHESIISNKKLHRVFLEECKQAGIPLTQWPFIARWKGRRSIDTFVQRVLRDHPERAARVRFGDVAGSKMLTGTGKDATMLAFAPFDVAEMDGHKIDLIGVVGIPTPAGIAWVPIERVVLLLIADAFSGAILGYFAVIRREANADDMLAAVSPMAIPWRRRDLEVEGMTYSPGSGLPLGTVEHLAAFGVNALMVDNALINLSYQVHDRIVSRFGCAVNWGQVRKWMRRPIIERINRTLEQAGFQRVVSTTGSHPKDPRRNDPVAAAMRHRVELRYLLDLIDVEIARYNAEPSEGRFGLSPLDVIEQTLAGSGSRTLIPLIPPASALHPEIDILVFEATIRGNHAAGRRPSIKFHRGVYTNPVIAGNFDLIGKKVVLHVRGHDIRIVEVFLAESGASLGRARVRGHWRRQPHTLEIRKQVNRFVDDGRLVIREDEDPVTALHRHLAVQATRGQKHPAKISREATQLAHESIATQRPIKGSVKQHRTAQKPFTPSQRAPMFRRQTWRNV